MRPAARDCSVCGHKRDSGKLSCDLLVKAEVFFNRGDALQRVVDFLSETRNILELFRDQCMCDEICSSSGIKEIASRSDLVKY